MLKVRQPGARCTIQDAGRAGMRRFGIPASGAMDQFSFRVANLLVGNDEDAAALEITLMGFVAQVLQPTTIAVTGGDLALHINDKPAPRWHTLPVAKGDIIAMKGCVQGCRTYLAVHGGIASPVVLGSQSVFAKAQLGEPIKQGDVVHCHDVKQTALPSRGIAHDILPTFGSTQTIRVMPGPQADDFSKAQLKTFYNATYKMTAKSDRQGMRTDGPAIKAKTKRDMITDPTPPGAVQIPADGKPIILLRDGQVTGGYRKIAIVASVDLDRLARLAPGDEMKFVEITPDEARDLKREQVKQLARLAIGMRINVH